MRKLAILMVLLFFLASVSLSDVRTKTNFIQAADVPLTIMLSTTVVNGTDFDSKEISLSNLDHPVTGLFVTFTRTTGAASTLDINFEVSYDNGTTWGSYDDGQVSVATNHAEVDTDTVNYYTLIALYGATHVRIKSMVNNWSGGSLTLVQVTLTTSRAR